MAETATSEYQLSTEEKLKAFVADVLEKTGVAPEHARVVGEVLVAADLRGIESHGVARLESYYVSRIRGGKLKAKPNYAIVRETETTVLFDADNGLGHPVAKLAMQNVIEKAKKHGSAFGAVRNSNHYGIAGYYAMMALEHDMIGMSSTNTRTLRRTDVRQRYAAGHQSLRVRDSHCERTGVRTRLRDDDRAERQTRSL